MEDIVLFGATRGLRLTVELIHLVSRFEAFQILVSVLESDLAYNAQLMPRHTAEELASQFLALFPEPAVFATNGQFLPSPDLAIRLSTWNPLTPATFDTGVICASPSTTGLLWVQDED